jgi:hypothetical protein
MIDVFVVFCSTCTLYIQVDPEHKRMVQLVHIPGRLACMVVSRPNTEAMKLFKIGQLKLKRPMHYLILTARCQYTVFKQK